MDTLLDDACARGLTQDSVVYRDLFDTRLMNCLMPFLPATPTAPPPSPISILWPFSPSANLTKALSSSPFPCPTPLSTTPAAPPRTSSPITTRTASTTSRNWYLMTFFCEKSKEIICWDLRSIQLADFFPAESDRADYMKYKTYWGMDFYALVLHHHWQQERQNPGGFVCNSMLGS